MSISQGDRATASLIATLTGGQGGLIPERGAIYSINSGWRRDGKELDLLCRHRGSKDSSFAPSARRQTVFPTAS